ncbi:MAG: hypothetical protein M1825_004939 [Sarcosagium campestre]|nr:MAG: hypothetical protein M1825_004939 [Sarcosagium campestre]
MAYTTAGYDVQRGSRQNERELQFLGDPFELARRVEVVLSKGNEERALELVRTATKDMQTVVSWNHILDRQMRDGKANMAMKFFNEMKKRGQTPNAQTYTILLRGFARWAHYPGSVSNAVGLYKAMDTAESKIKPAVIHTNAVLKVCARAGDMDSMWKFAANLPERGEGAPDTWTWTTILNAVKFDLLKKLESSVDIPEAEKHTLIDEAISQGRRMWADIKSSWTKGELAIDEGVVCSYGRLLLQGNSRHDIDSVLTLCEETMRIPKQTPDLEPLKTNSTTDQETTDPDLADARPDDFGSRKEPPKHVAGPTTVKARANKSRIPGYAQPSNNTLALVIEACRKLRSKKSATAYWQLLTSPPWAVEPDMNSYACYLRLLRDMRSSSEAAELICGQISGTPNADDTARKCFRIGVSVCSRDELSPRSFHNATRIVDAMRVTLADPSVEALKDYLKMAVRTDDRDSIIAAVELVGPQLKTLRSQLAFGDAAGARAAPRSLEADVKELARRLQSTYSRLLAREKGDREERRLWARERAQLQAFLNRGVEDPKPVESALEETRRGDSSAVARQEWAL